jgi:hypothetical protein
MLRVVYPRLASRLATPHVVQASSFACRRTFFTLQSIRHPQVEKYVTKEDSPAKESKGIPTEGLHYKGSQSRACILDDFSADLFVSVMNADEVLGAKAPRADYHSSNQITKTPTGDWVLFHPVYGSKLSRFVSHAYIAGPRYTEDELKSVSVFHRAPEDLGDKIALGLVKLAR